MNIETFVRLRHFVQRNADLARKARPPPVQSRAGARPLEPTRTKACQLN